jgi:tetratricopeptide (TPR) repeat protein
MAIDPYASCPGGTGKKIKFCCPDLTHELERVFHMVEAEQRAACLDHIEGLEAKYPDRACLLSVKAMLQEQLGRHDDAKGTLAKFMQKYPENPVALAEMAVTKLTSEGARAAMQALGRALGAIQQEMPAQVYEAIQLTAEAFLAESNILAARGLLMLAAAMRGPDQNRIMQMLSTIDRSPEISPLLKQGLAFVICPDDAPYKRSFDAAMEFANKGMWIEASDRLYELAAKAGDWPPIWQNIATLRSWIGDTAGTVRALRKLVTQNVPEDDAIEFEGLAQLLETEIDRVDTVKVEIPVSSDEQLAETLASHREFLRLPVDLSSSAAEGQPPARGMYIVLDRPMPTTGEDLPLADVPRSLGQIVWFGKETDRSARIEFFAPRDEHYENALSALKAALGDLLGARGEESVTMSLPKADWLLTSKLVPPLDTPQPERTAYALATRHEALLQEWPQFKRQLFSGKSAQEAASDPAMKLRVAAAVLILEMRGDGFEPSDIAALRETLGLPQPAATDPTDMDTRTLTLPRLLRLDVTKLSDENLVSVYEQSNHFYLHGVFIAAAKAIIDRPSLDNQIDKSVVMIQLAQFARDGAEMKTWFDRAREANRAKGLSTAQVELNELQLHLARRNGAEAQVILERIYAQHISEPGVQQTLFTLLYNAGLISETGMPSAAMRGAGENAAASPAASGGLWTPDSAAAAPAKKSAIWTPDS